MRFEILFSRPGCLLAGAVSMILLAVLWLALPEPRPEERPLGPMRLSGAKAESERYVPCPAGTRPKPGQRHICVPEVSLHNRPLEN